MSHSGEQARRPWRWQHGAPALLLTLPVFEPPTITAGRKVQSPTPFITVPALPVIAPRTAPTAGPVWNVGDEVVLKPGVPAPSIPSRAGTFRYRIEQIDGNRLYLSSNGAGGWVKAQDVLPAGDVLPYHDRAVRRQPDVAWTHARRALALYEKGNYDAALADFDEAIRLDPTRPSYYSNRAAAWLAKKQYARTVTNYSKAIELDPEAATAYYGRGLAYQLQNQTERALTDYTKAIRLHPKLIEAYNNRGLIYLARNDYDRAIADFNEAIRLNPEGAVTYNNRGNAWQGKGNPTRALADYTEAIHLNGKYAKAYSNRAYLRELRADALGALADYATSIAMDPKNAWAQRRLAWIRATNLDRALRDGPAAVRAATTACELTAWNDPESLSVLAASEAEAGHFAEATKWQAEALRLLPASSPDQAALRARLDLYRNQRTYREDVPQP